MLKGNLFGISGEYTKKWKEKYIMNIQLSILFKYAVKYVLFLLGVNENRWLHNSQNSFLEYLSHCNKQSWCIYLMEPVQMQG